MNDFKVNPGDVVYVQSTETTKRRFNWLEGMRKAGETFTVKQVFEQQHFVTDYAGMAYDMDDLSVVGKTIVAGIADKTDI